MKKLMLSGLICAAALLSFPLFAGKPVAGTNTPVTVTLRCPGLECLATDRIEGDFYGPYGGDVTKYYLNTGGDLWMRVDLPRTFALDFTQSDGIAPCVSAKTGCRRNFSIIDTPSSSTAVNPTDAGDVLLANGFLDIPVGGSAFARLKINFPDPSGRAILWTVRFNSGAYPGSTNVAVRRISENTWEVEATEADRARLVSSTTSGKPVGTDEGLYVMPFKMTVVK